MTPGDEFLLAFHAVHPGCTSEALGRGRLPAGSSYDLLAELVPGGPASGLILDLGCGDGHLLQRLVERGADPHTLVGIDMSPAELALAAARPALAGAALHLGRAQTVPMADGSASMVLSHLAWMLMSDIERVVAEVARVLRPGGVFATVVGGGPKVGDAFALFVDLLIPTAREVGLVMPRLGDKRCRDEDGLAELLGPAAGFASVVVDDHSLDLSGTLDEVWDALRTMYEMGALADDVAADLKRRFEAAARSLARPGGPIPCTMFLRRAVAVRG